MAKSTVPINSQIDVMGGRCTYGEMVELGRVLDSNIARSGNEREAIKLIINVLHPEIIPAFDATTVSYVKRVIDGVRFWREQEAEKLKYTPSAEEKQAGYEALAKITGPTGIASTIAEKFGVEGGPDAVFKWPYATVFSVLRIDLERYKFQKKLQDIHDDKRRRDEKNRRWNRK